ncbi:MAG: carbohydrate binding family 9 domain-containing protein [Melioribacter sp.]|nr:carbohydrate binding family 9 domain-containing protein [Melioribacter sp.]
MKFVCQIIFYYFIFCFTLFAERTTNNKIVSAVKVDNLKITVDGKLEESVWQSNPIKGFIQREPNEGMPASEETYVWVAYDEENIYVAARCFDSQPELIDVSLTRRDNYILSDWFAFYVDPYNDKKNGYFFVVNAGGSIIDGVLFNDSWDDDAWDGIWEAKTQIDKQGWTVEMKIPFSQLRFKESDVMKWGVNFAREIKRKNERAYFVMVPKNESGFVSRFATLEGLVGIKYKQRFEIIPYVVQKTQYLVHDNNDPFYKSNQYKTSFGADFKIGISSNLNLDATINPDFGQVEVDPAVINLTAFESYFQEKRTFFIEGANIFYFGIGGANNNWGFNFGWPELFYSRRIGRKPQGEIQENYDFLSYPLETRILGAAKITGKLNEKTSLGLVSAVTERTFAKFSKNGVQKEQEIEPLTHYGVLRTKREFNKGMQSLGLMLTTVNRDLHNNKIENMLSKNAYVLGVDGWTFLHDSKVYVLSGACAFSYTEGTKGYLLKLQKKPYRYFQRPDAVNYKIDSNRTSLSGYYGRLMLNKQEGNFYLNASLGAVSPGFEHNDLGFQWMADRINGHIVLGYRWFEPKGIFRSRQLYLAHARSYNYDGILWSNFIWYRVEGMFTNYYYVATGGSYQFETYSPFLTRGGPLAKNPTEWNLWFYLRSDEKKKVIVELETVYAEDKLGGNYKELNLDLEWKPNSQIKISLGPAYSFNNNPTQWINNFEDPFAVNTYHNRYVFGKIIQHTLSASLRLNWTFTPKLTMQVYLQPFFSVGDYMEFKELKKPKSMSYLIYDNNNSTIFYDNLRNEYEIDPDGNGPAKSFRFNNPDFNFKSIRGTAVLRWEIKPGSVLYLVWSHNQANEDNPGDFRFIRNIQQLWNSDADNVFLIKFTYWFNILNS